MMRMRFLLPLVVVLAASCTSVESSPTPLPSATLPTALPTVKPSLGPTGTWSGVTFRVETDNLIIDYPDFVDPGEARKHADKLQAAYAVFRTVFSFDDKLPYGGRKAEVVFRTDTKQVSGAGTNRIFIGWDVWQAMQAGYVNPPSPVFLHEMTHLFTHAQEASSRYYVYQFVGGMNEAVADYFPCHPSILALWSPDRHLANQCDLWLDQVGAKSPEWTLAYFEANRIDPYSLDWNEHPGTPSGESLFPQMLARISDKAGWDTWEKLFSATKAAGGNPTGKRIQEAWAETKPIDRMNDPLVRQAFREFVDSLGQAAGEDLRPMFRAWRFDV
jgi:hypothetical protein